MTAPEVFQRMTAAFHRCGIAYMLTGSFASSYYGASRSTQDIDFVIEATPAQLRTFVQDLPETEYYVDLQAALEAFRRQSQFNVIDQRSGWKLDLMIRKARPFSEEEFGRRQLVELEGLPLFVASAEDVILSKLEWSKLAQSPRQIEDVAGILKLRWDLLDHLYLKKWIQTLQLRTQWSSAVMAAGISE